MASFLTVDRIVNNPRTHLVSREDFTALASKTDFTALGCFSSNRF